MIGQVQLIQDGVKVYDSDVPISPDPTPTPPSSGGLAAPKNQAQLQAMLQDAASAGRPIAFDPSVDPISIQGTLEVVLKDTGTFGPKFIGNGVRLQSTNADDATTCLRFTGTARNFRIDGFTLYGNGYNQKGCGNGIEVTGNLYRGVLRDLNVECCGLNGIAVLGDVFEFSTFNLISCSNKQNGLVYRSNGGVISNAMNYGANLSWNHAYGLSLEGGTQSCDLFGGSFICNGLGGVHGNPRSAWGVNGENTGESLFVIDGPGYPTRYLACNMSSDGKTRLMEAPNSKVSRFVFSQNVGNLVETGCYVTPYGSPPPTNLQVFGP